MIDTPTVLVLGAGASKHALYPLGTQLLDDITRHRYENVDLPPSFAQEEVVEFISRLSRSGHYSVDAFLEQNTYFNHIGKFLIARELKGHEHPDRLFAPHDQGWYRYLFNALLVDGRPDFDRNNLAIVTFNYDRSLEAYLHGALQGRFGISADNALDYLAAIPIIHVHGILGTYPNVAYEPHWTVDSLLEIAQKINIPFEFSNDADDYANPMYREASTKLRNASRVCFLGFGFHQANVDRLRFFNHVDVSRVELICNTVGGAREQATLRTYFQSMDAANMQIRQCRSETFFTEYVSLT